MVLLVPSFTFLFPFWAPLVFLPEIRWRYIAEPHSLWQALLGSRTPVFPDPFFFSSLTMNFQAPCTRGAWEAQLWPVRYERGLLVNVWEWHCAPDKKDRYKRRVCQWVLPPSSHFGHRFDAQSCNGHCAIMNQKHLWKSPKLKVREWKDGKILKPWLHCWADCQPPDFLTINVLDVQHS